MEKRIRERAENATINREVKSLQRACGPSMPAFPNLHGIDSAWTARNGAAAGSYSENRSPKKPESDALLKQLRNPTVRSPESGVRFSLKTHENHVVRPAGIEPATLSLEASIEIPTTDRDKEG